MICCYLDIWQYKTKSYPCNRLHLNKSHRFNGKNSKVKIQNRIKWLMKTSLVCGKYSFPCACWGSSIGKGPKLGWCNRTWHTEKACRAIWNHSFNEQVHSLKCAMPEFLYPCTHSWRLFQLSTQNPFQELENLKTKSCHGERDVQKARFYNRTTE